MDKGGHHAGDGFCLRLRSLCDGTRDCFRRGLLSPSDRHDATISITITTIAAIAATAVTSISVTRVVLRIIRLNGHN